MRLPTAAATLLLVLPLAACTGASEPAADPGPSVASTPSAPSPTPSETSPDPAPTGEPDDDLPPVRDRVSLAALMREDLRVGPLRRTRPLAATENWSSWAVTYTVNGATVSGELLVPTGRGPFPALVLNHGYIEPSYYQLGQGMSREQEWLAAAGFVVLHTDYRGHAESDPVAELDRESRLVYTRDAMGAVEALTKEAYVDEDRLGFVGRSMGGGITYNAIVADPDLVDAAVVFAPVSSDFVDNLRQFTEPNRPDGASGLYARHGTPEESPGFYRGLSSRTYFDRIEVPVLIHHGTLDDTCPPAWSRETHRLMRRAGVDSTLVEWPGEGHAFGPRFADSMRRTVAFLRAELRL